MSLEGSVIAKIAEDAVRALEGGSEALQHMDQESRADHKAQAWVALYVFYLWASPFTVQDAADCARVADRADIAYKEFIDRNSDGWFDSNE